MVVSIIAIVVVAGVLLAIRLLRRVGSRPSSSAARRYTANAAHARQESTAQRLSANARRDLEENYSADAIATARAELRPFGATFVDDPNGGARVTAVDQPSAAERLGLRLENTVTSIDATQIADAADAERALDRSVPGRAVVVEWRDGDDRRDGQVVR